MSVMDDSIELMPENMTFLCENTRCKVFQVEPVFKSGRARKRDLALKNNAAFLQAYMDAMDIACEQGRHMYYSGARPWLVTSQFCRAPYDALIVNHNSEFTTCYEVYDRNHELGDLFFYGGFEDDSEPSFDHLKRERLLKKIQHRQMICSQKQCFCYPFCAGDCPPKAFLAGNDSTTGYSQRCELNRELTRELFLFYIEKSGGIWRGEKHLSGSNKR